MGNFLLCVRFFQKEGVDELEVCFIDIDTILKNDRRI